MTLTMQQTIALLRNAINDQSTSDVKLMMEIIIRSAKDQPILSMQPEVEAALQLGHDYMNDDEKRCKCCGAWF